MDEAVARAKLAEMQERIIRDPFDALGVPSTATPLEARAAFLELAKTYHPARFGRMPAEIQRLANEVFLALRDAYESIAKLRSSPASTRSQSMPVVRAPTAPGLTPHAAAALAAGTARGAPLPSSLVTRSPGPATRATTPPQGIATHPTEYPKTPTPQTTVSTQVIPRVGTLPPRTTPAHATTEALPRVGPPPTPQHPHSAEIPPLAKQGAAVAKATPSAGTRAIAGTETAEERDVASAIELLQRGQWDAGRAILQSLADKHPGVARYRALVSYAVGRQAQIEQRLNEARVELDRALQIDPTLQLAKTALGELFTRRK